MAGWAAEELAVGAVEAGGGGVADQLGDLLNRQIGALEQQLRPVHALGRQVLGEGASRLGLQQAGKIDGVVAEMLGR